MPPTPPAPASWLRRASAWISQTAPNVSAVQQRQARLLAWLMVASVVIGTLAGLIYQLIPGLGPAMSAQAWLVILVVTLLLGISFWLNRSGRSQWAAWLVVLLFSVATWGIVLADQPNYAAQPELRVELLFPLLAILVCGLLLPAWATGLWAAANLLALISFASAFSLAPSFTLQGLTVFYVFVSLLSALAGELRRRDLAQLEAHALALAASEAEYRRIVDLAQEGIWILDASNITRFVNRKMADLLGYTEAEMLGASAFEFMDDEGRAMAAASLARHDSRLAENEDFKLRHRDGSVRWVILANAPLTDATGAYTGTISLVTDVTERREAEDRLRQSQALFHSAFAYAAIGMSVVDMNGRYIQVNDALCRLVGYSETELLATTYHNLTIPEDQQLENENAARLLAGEISSYQVEKRYFHKQGHLIWVLISVSLVHDAAGQARYSVAQVQDITAHKRDSASLRENNERYRQMLTEAQALRQFNDSIAEVMAEGLILEDNLGSITLVNPKLQAMLGYTAEELVGRSATSLVAERDIETVSRHTAQRANGITSRYEATLLTKDGRDLPVLISATPLTKDGRFAGTLATLTDISARIQSEAALKQANTLLTSGLAESERRSREIAQLNELGEMLQTSLAPEEAYAVVAQFMPALFPGSAGWVYLIKESRNMVEPVAQWGPVRGEAQPFTPSECWGLRRGRLHVMEHLPTLAALVVCPHLAPPWPDTYVCVPMVAQGETVGVLHLQHAEAGGGVDGYWTLGRQQLARTVADSVGLALANL
ncbi:MAG: PAS domain S-box protein, partial [Anaerolineales bacterium]